MKNTLLAYLLLFVPHSAMAMDIGFDSSKHEAQKALKICTSGIITNDIDKVKAGLNFGVPVNSHDLTCDLVVQAICYDRGEILKLLLSQPSTDVNNNGALHLAIASKNQLSAILDYPKRNINQIHQRPLVITGYREDHYIPCLLTPLQRAIKLKQESTITQLLNQPDIDVNMTHSENCAPLLLAIKRQLIPAVQQLLNSEKIDIEIQGPQGSTPLHLACQNDNDLCISLLINKKANPLALNQAHQTPLAVAFTDNKINIIGEDHLTFMLQAQDAIGNTQLHKCATIKYTQNLASYLNFLSSNGVKIWLRNKNGFTAFDLAYRMYRSLLNENSIYELQEQAKTTLIFLSFIDSKREYALFKEIFDFYKNNFKCPLDIILMIRKFYCLINTELKRISNNS